uniref:M48 family metallopeptidase n=1 Tax=Roseihalotalea indica TaxID=2867963 RepID=A0AA49JDC9_9BACT|nr:M48 family metallopeptidase [Tunicatimonas sp. TK19036]
MKRTIFSSILAFFFLLSCSTVPLTGRKQLNLIPTAQINSLSFQSYQEVLSESKLSNDQQQVALIRKVGKKLSYAIEQYMKEQGHADELDGFKWEFNLIEDDKTVNAWCMPGGKVAFYTGIMPICQDEEGVAVVMSHEIAHAIASHGNERMSQQLALQAGGTALSVALQEKPQLTQQLALAAFGLGSQVGILLPYGRSQESEADELGLYMMAMAGYNPEAAVPFWQRMNSEGGQRPPEFLSTHPAPETRIKRIQQVIPKTSKYQNKYVASR